MLAINYNGGVAGFSKNLILRVFGFRVCSVSGWKRVYGSLIEFNKLPSITP